MKTSVSILSVAFVALLILPISVSSADVDSNDLLLDYGNGEYEWFSVDTSGTYLDVLRKCKSSVSYEGSSLNIDGISRTTISGSSTVTTDWKIYTWDGSKWNYSTSDPTSRCTGTTAFGFFPDNDLVPSASPIHPTVWTQFGGSSSASNTSPSYGPDKPALPVEWYNTYSTGYVDSGLVVSGDLIYHTTGGSYGVTTSDKDPWIYCLDRFTGEVKWKYHATYGSGYEVTTPLIVGDILIVTTTCGDMYAFDRFTGDVLDKVNIPFQPPVGPDGDVLWDGRTFVTGGTTPVYDSGAIFFGSADGRVYSYSVSQSGKLTQIWCYDPPSTSSGGKYTGSKGSFYYHAPTISEVDGKKILFIGNYEGYIHAVDITNGSSIWVKRLIDLRENNRCVPGTPGSVGSVSISPDGKMLLASCTDGGLFTLDGYLLALDPKTGDILRTTDGDEWKLGILLSSPVVTDSGFYSFVSPIGAEYFISVEGERIDATSAFYKFDWDGKVVWKSTNYQLIKAPLTLADGVLYAMDYSAGSFWPSGGAITAISAEDGSELWRLLLSPYTTSSYSMVQPTVIDGKIYAANDFGAIYCLSTIAGAGTEEEQILALQTQGFRHWSWAVVAVVIIGSLILLARFY